MNVYVPTGNLCMGDLTPYAFHKQRRLTTAEIRREVERHFGLRQGEIMERSRKRYIAHPRQVAFFLSRTMTKKSLPDIGRLFGGFDHTTVIHAVKAVNERIIADPDFAADVAAVKARLSA